MLQVTPHHRILLAVEPIDFRKGVDGIAAVCRRHLAHDPFTGHVFVFSNKSRRAIKILVYDGQGFWLCMKRFSQGKLRWWPKANERSINFTASQLAILLNNGNPETAQLGEDWRPLL